MRLPVRCASHPSQGHALLLVLVLSSVVLILMASTLSRTKTDVVLNARNNQYQATIYAAEAATEEVVARVEQDFRLGNLTWVSNRIADGTYQSSVPNSSQDSYWSNFEFSDGLGHKNRNLVVCLYTTGWSPLRSLYEGLSGWTNHLYIIANARQLNTPYDIPVAVQQDVELDLIPLFQYAIFYNSLLEFTWCAPMTVNGRTHSNTNMYTGSTCQLTFNQLVDVSGNISSPAWGGHRSGDYTVPAKYNGGYITNAPSLALSIGTNTADLNREIINMPPATGDTNATLSGERYYNKAGVVLLVSNTTVSAIIRSPTDGSTNSIKSTYTATNYSSVSSNFPFLTINSTNVYDDRESATLKLSDIDVSILNQWLFTNAAVQSKFPRSGSIYPSQTNAPNIMYVADNRSYSSGQLTAVRLKNATTIPTNLFNFAGTNMPSGFTLATPNPLYVWGNYNVPNGSAYWGSTNTPAAGSYPASLVSDALTVLSGAWDDSKSKLDLASRNPVTSSTDVTVNAAILTGVVYSTGSSDTAFSGGVHNLPRLLENWGNGNSSIVLTLNTSIVNLFNSARATNQFRSPGDYYYAPTRNFSFDPNLLLYYKQPPGTPMANWVIRAKWSTPRPYTTNYAGF